MKKRLRATHGFTLVEVLISIAVSMIILVAATNLLVAGFNMYNQTSLLSQAHTLGMVTEQKITNEVIYATGVSIAPASVSALNAGVHSLYLSADARLARDTGTAGGANTHDYNYYAGYYTGLSLAITYSKSPAGALHVDIKVLDKKSGSLLYEPQTDIVINNGAVDTSAAASGPAIAYSLPNG